MSFCRGEDVHTDDAAANAKVLRVRHDREREAGDPRHLLAQPVAVVDARLADGGVDGGVEALADQEALRASIGESVGKQASR